MKPLVELTLDQMLDDPIVHLTMARDGVRAGEVRDLMSRLKAVYACKPPREEAALDRAA